MKDKPQIKTSNTMIFEAYILALLKALAKSENKRFFSEFIDPEGSVVLDGYAPDGLYNIKGILAIEIKQNFPPNFNRIIERIFRSPIPVDKVLVIINSIKATPHKDDRIVFWTQKDIKDLSEKFPEVAFQFSDYFIPGILEYSETKQKTKNLVQKTVKIYENTKFNENKEDYIKNLIHAFEEDNLVLFLGSGVSQAEGLPSWKGLIETLITDFLKINHGKIFDSLNLDSNDEFKSFSYITLGRFIKKALKSDFHDKLKNALYRKYKHVLNSKSLLNSIGMLCRPIRSRIGVYAIVTYNYDDILEFYFKEMGVKHKVIYKEYDIPVYTKLPIYHVHGYIPKNGKFTQEKKNSIVFAEEEYHSQYKEPYSWQNLIQLNLLKEKTVLFIGLSMNDPNLRRLLDIAKGYSKDSRHYAIVKDNWKFENERISNIFRSIEEGVFEELGINVIWYKEHSEISAIIDEIYKT